MEINLCFTPTINRIKDVNKLTKMERKYVHFRFRMECCISFVVMYVCVSDLAFRAVFVV